MMNENSNWEEHNNYFYLEDCTDSDSEDLNQKRTSLSLDNVDKEQQYRETLIQKATTRLRRRMLEQGLQDVISQVVSLQTQLESLRLDAVTTIDTISDIFDNNNKEEQSLVKMNRQMDVFERRLSSHKSSLEQFIITPEVDQLLYEKKEQQQQQQHQYQHQQQHHQKHQHQHQHQQEEEEDDEEVSTTPVSAMAMSRLSSLSLISSIFNRSSSCSSTATSISDQYSIKEQDESIIDDDCISHIENINGEDHPFYDLAGKRSFRAGSFCGSVYSEQEQFQQVPIVPVSNTSEFRWRRRQRRQKHQQHLEQQKQQQQQQQQQQHQQQQHYYSDNESMISDDLSSFGNQDVTNYNNNNNSAVINSMIHPLSPMLPPSLYYNHNNTLFNQHNEQEEELFDSNNETQFWLQSNQHLMETTCIYPQRNVLHDTMSYISENIDDMSFCDDIYLLLRHPELCSRPFSEIQMQELRQQEEEEQHQLNHLKQTNWCVDMVYKTTCTSLQWCRFLSVLSAAVVISIMKGPEDVRRHSF